MLSWFVESFEKDSFGVALVPDLKLERGRRLNVICTHFLRFLVIDLRYILIRIHLAISRHVVIIKMAWAVDFSFS